MRSRRAPAQRAGFVALIVLWMALAGRVPAAMSQPPNAWSIQLDGGLFAPIESNGTSPTLGMRYSKHFGTHMQGGLLTGWTWESKRLDAPADGSQNIGTTVELARVDAYLVPVMGFLQVNFTERSWLVPFVGVGAGFEWLGLDAVDHRTGLKSNATYANLAWQGYGGLGFRLTSEVRLNGELYYNGGSLERAYYDTSGRIAREAVDVNGVGVRVGLDMVFE